MPTELDSIRTRHGFCALVSLRSMKIRGKCACGRCAYEVSDDDRIDVATCHCALCRKVTGGTMVTWATVPLSRFRWIGAEPRLYRSSKHGKRYFCASCGAHLALWTSRSPDTIDLAVATFAHPDRYPPNRHIWTQTRLSWVRLDDGLPTEPRESIAKSGRTVRRGNPP